MPSPEEGEHEGREAASHARWADETASGPLVVLGLGANLGDPETTLLRAYAHFAPWVTSATIASPYRTAPISPIPQPDFLNTVVVAHLAERDPLADPADPADTARRWVAAAKQLERRAGRRAEPLAGPRYGPRPLDVDLLLLGPHVLDLPALEPRPSPAVSDALEAPASSGGTVSLPAHPAAVAPWPGPITVPHPRLRQRRFVLAPLAELAPELALPPDGVTVSELLERLEGGPGTGQRVERLRWTRPPSRGAARPSPPEP